MQKLLFYFLTVVLLTSCQPEAADNDKKVNHKDDKGVPEVVKAAFEKKYPNEYKPEWNTDRNGNFEAEFKEDGERYRADFTPAGQWIETENSIKEKELPQAIREVVEKQYGDYKIVELERVDSAKKGVFYDVEIKKDGEKMDVEFNERGEIIGIEK